jgi:DNA helicase-2/ATP-dependent DNA helicase PcrA
MDFYKENQLDEQDITMTFEQFIQKFNIELNQQQLEAVQSIDCPTLLLAVPGSGKTTVLVTRLGYMIYCCGIHPEQILTVTYTVSATKDMRKRFADIFGSELADRLEFRTINGICAKIISYYGKCVGRKAFDLTTEEGYKTKLLSSIYVNMLEKYPTENDLKNISTQITYIKNMMLSERQIEELGEQEDIPLLKIYKEYCNEMRRQSLMDYDDQMVYALTMLKNASEVLEHFQEVYQYICVDEAQDTSKIQHEIIALLAKKYENLFMVGDEDQSIYGFRAAYPEALLSFEKNYEKAKVFLMEENFRSNAKIVEAADQFIQKNELRHEKHMTAFKSEGRDIQNIPIKSRRAQYTYLVKVAGNCLMETAVLYRDNESILPVVDLLERKGIPYRIKNADLTFFSHRVVLDIENIIKFAADQTNTELFMQIYYKIGTYMSKLAAIEACRISEEKNISVLDAALNFGKIPAGTQKGIRSVQTHMKGLLEERADKAVYRIAHFMGYNEYLERVHIKSDKVQILEAIAANETSALRFVERLKELSQLIKEKTFDPDCNFILSTIHSSKGLEYDRVYLMDAKDGIFPEKVITNPRKASKDELKIYEEERRLYYVGVTRAKEVLCIFRFIEGATFTDELLGLDIRTGNVKVQRKCSLSQANALQKKQGQNKVTQTEYLEKLREIQETGFVRHKKYGQGKVLSVNGDVLEIAFEDKTTKCMLRFMMEHELLL